MSGVNLKPWPLHGEPMTIGPRRSNTKSSSGVLVYRHVSVAPVGRCGAKRAPAKSVTLATRSGSGSKERSSGSTAGPDLCTDTLKWPGTSGLGTTYGVWTGSTVQSMIVGKGDGSSNAK
jgi:hypothetical protein